MSATVVFDLDDTLVKEIDYLKSAFKAIAVKVDSTNDSLFNQMLFWYQNKENVFQNIESHYGFSVNELKQQYRTHVPDFIQYKGVSELLLRFKEKGCFIGLITDGYSLTQRNKLKALGIEELFDLIVISEEFGSEKPNENNYKVFHQLATKDYYYIGDNTAKDFLAPNRLGWISVCLLNNGENIHPQDFTKETVYLPQKTITDLNELFTFI
ncbi:MAG: HAD family hydrolase [Flavobacterium sp.]|uniref:HAD family hydrolase n=1 Tax=Flavobacterium sp. TaxID=239 RepID=UPI0025B94E6F|nr:HAD family hydrolase [Flavobacterium sp.]MBA4135232.1 HAD family hydrolase [Flavobacterium sp.]